MRDNLNWLSTCHGCRVITLNRFSVFGIYFPNPRISAPWLDEIVRDHVGKACRKNEKNLNSLTTVNQCSRLRWCHLNACMTGLLCERKQQETAAYHRTEHHLLLSDQQLTQTDPENNAWHQHHGLNDCSHSYNVTYHPTMCSDELYQRVWSPATAFHGVWESAGPAHPDCYWSKYCGKV